MFPCPAFEFSQTHPLWISRALTSVWDTCVGLVAQAALLKDVQNRVNEEVSQLCVVRKWSKR